MYKDLQGQCISYVRGLVFHGKQHICTCTPFSQEDAATLTKPMGAWTLLQLICEVLQFATQTSATLMDPSRWPQTRICCTLSRCQPSLGVAGDWTQECPCIHRQLMYAWVEGGHVLTLGLCLCGITGTLMCVFGCRAHRIATSLRSELGLRSAVGALQERCPRELDASR